MATPTFRKSPISQVWGVGRAVGGAWTVMILPGFWGSKRDTVSSGPVLVLGTTWAPLTMVHEKWK